MKNKITSSILLMVPLFLFGQAINSFDALPDSSYWGYDISENADSTLSYVNVNYVADPAMEGSGAMQLDYSAHNIEAWGGYAKIFHMLGGGDDEPGSPIEGTWMMAPEAGALMVGPAPNDGSWWSNSEEDVTARACLFDDDYVFNADGSFNNVLGEETWLEVWQGVDSDQCGAPVYPHDGSNAATYTYDGGAGTVTLNGVGAYLGLPKAVNEGELSSDDPPEVPESITYNITLSDDNNTMTLVIECGTGVFWTFKLVSDSGGDTGGTGIVFSGAFGGTIVDGNTYTFPTGAESWGGFANEDTSLYPFSFPDGGTIDFTGATAGTDVDVYFRFEYQPYPDVEPSYNTAAVTVSGTEEASYSVEIPEQGENTFSSFLLYVTTPDAPVTLTNVTVTETRSALAQANDWMTILETRPRDGEVWDWSGYDSISFSYYNSAAQSLPDRVHLRLNLSDYGDVSDPANYTGLGEYYYSFHYILDNDPGWNTVTMPLVRNDDWGSPGSGGGGFNLTGWAGDAGNGELDKDAIAGFHLEFSISGGGDGDYSLGTIILDDFTLTGTLNALENPGFELTDITGDEFGWGRGAAEGASASVEEDATVAHGGSNYAKISTTGDAQWAVHYTETPIDVSIGETWILSAWIKDISNPVTDGCSAGLKFEVYDAAGTLVNYETMFTDVTDEWGLYSVELVIPADMVTMKAVLVGQTWAGPPGDYAFDDVWLQNVGVLDLIPPDPVQNVSAVPADGYNLVTWSDNDGEDGETYNVYASTEPITDSLSLSTADVLATNVLEGSQAAVHYLYYPLEDTEVTYHYAVACQDASNNVGEPGSSEGSVTNVALGIPTISLDVPADFAADGNLDEWYDSDIEPFFLGTEDNSWGTPNFVGAVTDDNDLSGEIWLAVDEDYLYVAADVIDDVYDGYQPGDGTGGWWENDVLELFIGFYDQRGAKHVGMMRGPEPDYKFFFLETGAINDFDGQNVLAENGDGNYYQEGFDPDWVVEAKLALDDIAFGDDLRLNAVNGMRIPIEPTFHDNDGAGWEGNLVGSPLNADNAWQTPIVWSTTWIGDADIPLAIDGEEGVIANEFALYHNYPNPFNPVTTIRFSIPEAQQVTLKVYNLMGREVVTLVDRELQAGYHNTKWHAGNMASGIYFYRLMSEKKAITQKMILMK